MTGPAVLELDEAAAGAAIEALQAAARARRTPVDPPGERGDRPLVCRRCRVTPVEHVGICRPCVPAAETAIRRWVDWPGARQGATDKADGVGHAFQQHAVGSGHRFLWFMNTSFSNKVTSCSFLSSAPTSGGTETLLSVL